MINPIIQQLLTAPSPVAICWLGNDGWLVRAGGVLIGFDLDLETPNRLRPSPVRTADLCDVLHTLFISHEHGDHFNEATCAILAERGRCDFVVPASCLDKAKSIGCRRTVLARPRLTFDLHGLHVTPTRAFHGHIHQSVYRNANLDDCGYVIDVAGLRIFQPGDSVLTQEHLELTGIDALFVSPTDHNMHVRPAAALISALRPRWIFPQHFETYAVTKDNAFWTVGYPEELRAALPLELQGRYHKLRQGEVFEIQP